MELPVEPLVELLVELLVEPLVEPLVELPGELLLGLVVSGTLLAVAVLLVDLLPEDRERE